MLKPSPVLALLLALAGSAHAAEPPAAAGHPSLAKQLRADGVRSGSALEDLIRGNQDFSGVPQQPCPGLGEVPPWLVALFHKNHPRLAPQGACPPGGYPQFLP